MVGAALKRLAVDGKVPRDPVQAKTVKTLLSCLSRFRPASVFCNGKPEFVDYKLISAIAREGRAKGHKAKQGLLRCETSRRAELFGLSKHLNHLIDKLVGEVLPVGGALYSRHTSGYRDEFRVGPETFLVRAILVLSSSIKKTRSPLFETETHSGERKGFKLEQGDLIVFFPGSTLHRIRNLGANESLEYVSCDFQPSYLPKTRAPFVPTPGRVVDQIIKAAQVRSTDIVYDLGCGDGRILSAVSARGASGIGVEQDVALAETLRRRMPPDVTIMNEEIMNIDLRTATVITLFLNAETNEQLRPKLENELRPGARVVSHLWPIKTWVPNTVDFVKVPGSDFNHRLYFYQR